MNDTDSLQCAGLGVTFSARGRLVEALCDVSFATRPGEFLSIVGPSGAGKTTLLRTLAGLQPAPLGSVKRPAGGRTVLVRQEQNIFPWLTVKENAAFGLEMLGVSRRERQRRILPLLERFGLGGRENDYPGTLSAGMKQRVALVQAFVTEPAVLLMDEPFANLDCQTRWQLQGELLELWEEQHHRTVVLVTHDVDEALRLSDRVLVLSRQPGRVIAEVGVTLSRPRGVSVLLTPEFLELKRRLLDLLGFAVEEFAHGLRGNK